MSNFWKIVSFSLIMALVLPFDLPGQDAGYNLPDAGVWDVPYNPLQETKMEQFASDEEVRAFIATQSASDCIIFTEDRLFSIRRDDVLPAHWLTDVENRVGRFTGQAQPGEFYVFQLAAYPLSKDISSLEVSFTDLKDSAGHLLPTANFRCLSLGGIGPDGQRFSKNISVKKGMLQVLWIGVEVPKDAGGNYTGTLIVRARDIQPIPVSLSLTVAGSVLEDCGYSQATRLARLRWLDSTIGQNDENVIRPYTAVEVEGNTLKILGRKLILGPGGLPVQIQSYFNESNTRIENSGFDILKNPIQLLIQTGPAPEEWTSEGLTFSVKKPTCVNWASASRCPSFQLDCRGRLEFDGFVQYQLKLKALWDISVQDIRLLVPYASHQARLMMGLGFPGGRRPDQFEWKWDVSKYQDCLWMGTANAGLQFRFKAENYRRPLLNIYYDFFPLLLPPSWGNEGKGGVQVAEEKKETVLLTAFSGPRTMLAGEELNFDFDMYITPFRPVNTDAHWRNRYAHTGGMGCPYFEDLTKVVETGANVLNMHHASDYNPYINYPYNDTSFSGLIECAKKAHQNNIRLKIYYTTREITSNMPELFAFYSMNGEIIFPGPGNDTQTAIHPGGAHPWLRDHLRKNYIPAWLAQLGAPFNPLDLAVITTPDTRWNNFYLEGLQWLIQKAGIDGIYIDDTALDRVSLQRARRILDADGQERLIDFHSWNHYNNMAKFASCANIYMEIFPYLDSLWFGEGFDYQNTSPEYWLTEISGIPFGLTGEMLQDGGNPWRGMLYGMTTRQLYSGDNRPLWKVWDEFGIQESEMFGYWDSRCPVKTDHPQVLATAYQKGHKALIAIASWAPQDVECHLFFDQNQLPFPEKTTIHAPEIAGFQPIRDFELSQAIPVNPGKGWLLMVSE